MTQTYLPPAPAPSRPRWLIPVLAAGALLILALAGVAAWALLRDPAGKPTPAAPTKPATLIINGNLRLTDSSGVQNLDDTACQGMGGYNDIKQGSSVSVTDSAGKVVGIANLGVGKLIGSGMTRECEFSFSVFDVPAGLGFYGVEVSHRGSVQYKESDLGSVQVTLG